MSPMLRQLAAFFIIPRNAAYALFLCTLLLAAWGTLPYLNPPSWLAEICRSLFYREYIF